MEGKFQPVVKEMVQQRPQDVLVAVHQHIDNGGHTFAIDNFGNMVIETGFFGYSHTSVLLTSPDLDGLIKFLQDAKQCLADIAEE